MKSTATLWAAGCSCCYAFCAPNQAPLPPLPTVAMAGGRCHSPLMQLPFLQQNAPKDQQAMRELKLMKEKPFMDWAVDDKWQIRLGLLYAAVTAVVSLPISYSTYPVLPEELKELVLSSHIGTGAALLVFVARLRVGWGYVSGRLRNRINYYEEGGASGRVGTRGFEARKDSATLLRDRLVEKEEVQPRLERINGVVTPLLLSIVLAIAALDRSEVATLKVLSGDEAISYTNRLRKDDEFAAREQAKALEKALRGGQVRPTYCDSRYYKILAGGNAQGGVGCDGY